MTLVICWPSGHERKKKIQIHYRFGHVLMAHNDISSPRSQEIIHSVLDVHSHALWASSFLPPSPVNHSITVPQILTIMDSLSVTRSVGFSQPWAWSMVKGTKFRRHHWSPAFFSLGTRAGVLESLSVPPGPMLGCLGIHFRASLGAAPSSLPAVWASHLVHDQRWYLWAPCPTWFTIIGTRQHWALSRSQILLGRRKIWQLWGWGQGGEWGGGSGFERLLD